MENQVFKCNYSGVTMNDVGAKLANKTNAKNFFENNAKPLPRTYGLGR
jgi:hypothetical protein